MKEILKAAIEKFGEENQNNVAIEELSEVIKEVCKLRRTDGSKSSVVSLAEEIADAEISLDQLKIMYNCNGMVEVFKTQKLDRLKNKIGNI